MTLKISFLQVFFLIIFYFIKKHSILHYQISVNLATFIRHYHAFNLSYYL